MRCNSLAASVFLGTAALTFAAGSSAEIAQNPLIVANAAKSNLLVAIDDSGSMDWEVGFPKSADGILHWNDSRQNLVDSDGVLYNTFQNDRFSYLFPTGRGSGNMVYASNSTNGNILPPRPEYAFARSTAFNPQYYNPLVTYRPWVNIGSSTWSDMPPTAAKSDPAVSGSQTLNLTVDNYNNSSDDWRFRIRSGMRRPDASGNPGDEVSGRDRLQAFNYYPATYYMPITSSIGLGTWLGSGNCATPSAATYETFHDDWSVANQSDLSGRGVDAIAPGGVCLKRYEIKAGNTFPSGRSYADEMQNFANWFSYHRKRHLALRAGLGEAFQSLENIRAGSFTINTRDDVTMWDLDSSRGALYDYFYSIIGANQGTPNRQGLNHAGEQFDGNEDVITASCQHNFAMQFTDGYSTQFSTAPNVGNVDGDWGSPFQDTHSNTLGDIAALWYETRLRDGDFPAGRVPVPAGCSSTNPPAYLACETDLHMRTFAISLGAEGTRFGVDYHTTRDAHTTPLAWPDPSAESGRQQIDDLYHAAVNGRGELLNARSTQELTQKLREALALISEAVVSSSASAATNSTRVDADSKIYQARFNSGNWTGELLAYGIASSGNISGLLWDASQLIPQASSRQILTKGAGNTQVPFAWASLTSAQRDALDRNSNGQVDGLGEQRLAYLRGDASREVRNGGVFRDRARVLGDIVNSSPEYVGAQDFGFSQLPTAAPGSGSYLDYVQAKRERAGMIYVGANDGMLHAFDAETGIEQWAYVPSELVPAMRELTEPRYRHRYFVDGSPTSTDAYFSGRWNTVLVASLGAGGRTVVGIDVTNPGAPSLLWEFTHEDLGYVLGRPSIVRLSDGRWGAIIGSGYGLDKSAKLFVVDMQTGALISRISTVASNQEATATPNGMSPPLGVDVNRDRIADYVYAGDLLGNLWKFDLQGGNPNQWESSFSSGGSPMPLFTACATGDSTPFGCAAAARQPITARPEASSSTIGQRVLFGTGKYFEPNDIVVVQPGPVQSFYAIEDDNATRVDGRSELTEQEILSEGFVGPTEIRVTTDTEAATDSRGWYLDLVSPANGFEGERVVSQPVLYEGLVIFATLIPSSDSCASGGTSWLMALDLAGGGRPPFAVFDVNDDGVIDDDDLVTDPEGNPVPPSGRRSTVGIINTPRIVRGSPPPTCEEDPENPDLECPPPPPECPLDVAYAPGSSGQIEQLLLSGKTCSTGRTSWRQLWP